MLVRRRWWKIAVGASGFGPIWVILFLSIMDAIGLLVVRDWFQAVDGNAECSVSGMMIVPG